MSPKPKKITASIIPPSGKTCGACPLGGCASLTSTPPGSGFLKPYGAMRSGVMIVAEALGDAGEVKAERALVGPAGALLGRACSRKKWRVSDEFRCVTTLFCHPSAPLRQARNGWLQPWAEQALAHCAPNLQAEIETWRPKCIVALGDTAFQVLTGEHTPIMAARGYVFREKQDRCWVIPTFDPMFLMKGNQALTQVLLWDIAKAMDVAANGFVPDNPVCLMDPPLEVWEAYVADFLRDPTRPLATDIETPWRSTLVDEDDEDDKADITYTIDRVSFAFEKDRGVSVPWVMPYLPGIQRMLVEAGKHA